MELAEDKDTNVIIIQPQDTPDEGGLGLETHSQYSVDLDQALSQFPAKSDPTAHESFEMIPFSLAGYLHVDNNIDNSVHSLPEENDFQTSQTPYIFIEENDTHYEADSLPQGASESVPVECSNLETHTQENQFGVIKIEKDCSLTTAITTDCTEYPSENSQAQSVPRTIFNKFCIPGPGKYYFPGLGNVFMKEDKNVFTSQNVKVKSEATPNLPPKPHVELSDITKQSKIIFEGCTTKTKSRTRQIAQKCTKCGTWIIGTQQKMELPTSGIGCMSCNHYFHSLQEFMIHYGHVHVCHLEEYNGFKTDYSERLKKGVVACLICRKFAANSKVVLQHFTKVHNLSLQWYPCRLCPMITCDYEELARHWADVHNLSEKCRFCSESFTASEMDKHLELHNKIRCGKCKELVPIHKVNDHGLSCGGASIYCKGCGESFFQKRDLKVHLKNKHGLETFRCWECSDIIFDKGIIKYAYGHDRKGNFVCQVCTASFVYQQAYDKHVFKHTNQYPYSCVKCREGFPTISSKNQHLKICKGNKKKKKRLKGRPRKNW